MRLAFAGSRHVVLAPAAQVAAYATEQSMGTPGESTQQACRTFFRAGTKAHFEKFVQAKNDLWSVTLGKGDFLFIPARFAFAEQTLGDTDVVGFRAVPLVATEPTMAQMIQHADATQATQQFVREVRARLLAAAPGGQAAGAAAPSQKPKQADAQGDEDGQGKTAADAAA
ncbi:MAG: hypothetical protein GY772_24260 [bacterium]|nr:hypothetical protein [bacterium]